jgi:SAM-dependent methyltransferase
MRLDVSDLLNSVSTYYTGRLAEHGPTPRGVDWNSAESQHLRFEQLLRVCDRGRPFVLGDYGCGYGALCDYLRGAGVNASYRGFDISPAMLDAARRRCADDPQVRFSTDESVLADADYVVASGIFNVKLQTAVAAWEAYVYQTIDRVAAFGRAGFAFNALTSYSDPERMRADLYYPNPCVLFDYCKRRFSRHVALLHDYGLYEFTVLVRR